MSVTYNYCSRAYLYDMYDIDTSIKSVRKMYSLTSGHLIKYWPQPPKRMRYAAILFYTG